MQDFTTTSDDWSFSFQEPKPVFDTDAINMGQPYLAGKERWSNYIDDEVYEIECLLRQFLETKRHGWGTSDQSARKFTAGMMYEVLYGKELEKNAYATRRKLNRVMNHYATKIWGKKGTTIFGKKYSGKIYLLNAIRLDKPPYSLRLRLEWMAERGILPTYENMQISEKLPADGQPRTAKNAKYRAKAVRYARKEKRARNDGLYGDRPDTDTLEA